LPAVAASARSISLIRDGARPWSASGGSDRSSLPTARGNQRALRKEKLLECGQGSAHGELFPEGGKLSATSSSSQDASRARDCFRERMRKRSPPPRADLRPCAGRSVEKVGERKRDSEPVRVLRRTRDPVPSVNTRSLMPIPRSRRRGERACARSSRLEWPRPPLRSQSMPGICRASRVPAADLRGEVSALSIRGCSGGPAGSGWPPREGEENEHLR